MHFFGKNIRYLRKQHSKTQSELAALIGKGQTTIGNWENGISEPSMEELILLSNYFDTSIDILLKVDLSQTNYKTGTTDKKRSSGNKKQVKYDHTTPEPPAAHEPGIDYVLKEIRAMRKEIDQLKRSAQ